MRVPIFLLSVMMCVGPLWAASPEETPAEPAGPEAVSVAESFAELPDFVNLGDTVFVTDSSGRKTRAQIEELAPTSIQVMTEDGAPLVLSEDDVRELHVQYGDSVWNGALIGAGAGVLTVVLLVGGEQEVSEAAGGAALLGGLGAAVGAGIDALHKGRRLVYENPGAGSGARISVYPILTRHRRGVAVSVSF